MKKTNSIRDTLQKKVELPKNMKAQHTIEKSLKDIHQIESSEESYFRTTVYLPKSLHKELKIYVASQEKHSIKEFITQAVQEKLKRLRK